MLKYISYINEITVWWQRSKEYSSNVVFFAYLNKELKGSTTTTFYRFTTLSASTEYEMEIYAQFPNGDRVLVDRLQASTRKEKKIVDITKLDYYENNGLMTGILQRALSEIRADEILYFPSGVYLTGALDVHSDTEIYLEEGAIIKGSEEVADYLPKRKSRFEGIEMECYSSLLNLGTLNRKGGYSCTNVVIRGKGTIEGGGKALALKTIETERELLKDFLASHQELVASCETVDTIPARRRGRLINISNAQNVVLSGIEIKNGPAWNVHMIYSDTIVTEGCRFISDGVWNGDGWDPDSSTNCTIFDCFFNTGDDCVAIKSGKNPEGNIINKPSKDIFVFACKGVSGHGIAIGSEMSGGIDGVYVWDCDFEKSCYGVQIKSSEKRGGYLRNIHFEHCSFSQIRVVSVDYNNDGESAQSLPWFDGFYFENLRLTGVSVMRARQRRCCPIELEGINEQAMLTNVHLENIEIEPNEEIGLDDAIKLKFVKNLHFNNVYIKD